MTADWKANGPVVVGGLGGSGTRVVAEIMAALGYYVGSDLNSASDNLWFTFLFKRPLWYPQHRHDRSMIATGLGLLEKLMLRNARPTMAELRYLADAFRSISAHGFNRRYLDKGRKKWAMKRLSKMVLPPSGSHQPYVGWGWKEPNSHLLIDDMAGHFRNFRYIHTIRHGLDMAYSGNQEQLHLWSAMFAVDLPATPERLTAAAYRFWVNANRHAVKCGRDLGTGRFLLVNFDQLCVDPGTEVAKLASFLGVSSEAATFENAVQLIRPQSSTGRYRKQNLDVFKDEDLGALAEFGFSL